jgi:hypothetical protein
MLVVVPCLLGGPAEGPKRSSRFLDMYGLRTDVLVGKNPPPRPRDQFGRNFREVRVGFPIFDGLDESLDGRESLPHPRSGLTRTGSTGATEPPLFREGADLPDLDVLPDRLVDGEAVRGRVRNGDRITPRDREVRFHQDQDPRRNAQLA